MADDAQFFVGQKAFIQKGSEVLVLHSPGLRLDYPGGKIQVGETDLTASRWVSKDTYHEVDDGMPHVEILRKYFTHHEY